MIRLLAVVLLVAPVADAADPPKVKVKEYHRVVYSTVGKEQLRLELAVPDTPGPHPCVVCFHGGAWTSGDHRDLCVPYSFAPGTKTEGILRYLAANGFAAASVGYRLAPKHQFPAQIIDAKTAVRFLRANAKKYDLDPTRFAALGYSAGGHLAALLGTTDSKAGFDGKEYPDADGSVTCVVNFYGPGDLVSYGKTRLLEDAFMVPVLGKECRTDRTLYQKASPLEYVSKASAPMLIIHGTDDFIVPYKQATTLRDKLKECGVPVELLTLKGKGHGWDGDTADQTAAAAMKYLNAQLKKGAK